MIRTDGCFLRRDGFKTGHARKPQIHQDNIRSPRLNVRNRELRITEFPYYLHVRLQANDGADANTNQRVIVNDHDSNLLSNFHESCLQLPARMRHELSGKDSCIFVPRPGADSMAIEPRSERSQPY